MDGSEESYFNFFSDKAQSFLLSNNDEGLESHYSSLNVEAMFTEISDNGTTWNVDELPILMNDQQIDTTLNSHENSFPIYKETDEAEDSLSLDNSEVALTYPIEVSGNNFVTSDGLFLSNDILFHLQNDESVGADKDSFKIGKVSNVQNEIYTINFTEDTKNENQPHTSRSQNYTNEVIHLLNLNGSIINVTNETCKQTKVSTESMKNSRGKTLLNLDDFFMTLLAYKCKKCDFICESRSDIIKHITDVHLMTVERRDSRFKYKPPVLTNKHTITSTSNNEIKMKSILSSNNTNMSNKTVFLCSECNYGYSTTQELKDHMIIKHNLITLNELKKESTKEQPERKVLSTNEVGKDDQERLKHLKIIKKQSASKKIKCSIKGCDMRFSRDEYRVRHEKCHVDRQKNKYKCPVCDKLFSIWRICSMHLWKCHSIDLGLLTCPMCNEYKTMAPCKQCDWQSSSPPPPPKNKLMSHMAIHGNTTPFLCNVCGKTFKQSSQLRNHYICHNKSVEEMPSWANQQMCNICGNYFANSKCLKKHVQSVHDKFKPFICNICGHKTARKAMLDLHLRQHTGEKPHKCTICEYRTGDHNSFRRHMMRHNGDIKYSCPHCDYQSIQSTAYKNHIANKHPGLGGSYSCMLCSFNTVNENTYNNHLKEHKNKANKNDVSNKRSSNSVASRHCSTVVVEPIAEKMLKLDDDEETQNCFLLTDHAEDTVDTGGITIPAGLESQN